jgi:hypothetical protein
MAEDLSVQSMKVSDTSAYQRDGTSVRQRVYTFFLGKHGPFTERVPIDPTFDPNEIQTRITALRAHLANAPR